MTLSLGDVQRWEPDETDEVAKALAQRARSSGETAKTLRNLPVFETWDGDASQAAKDAVDHSATKLEVSAKDAFLASLAAQKCAQDAQSVKNDLAALLSDAAAAPAVQIDLDNSRIISPDTTGWADEDVDKLADKIEDLENRIVAVLAAAEETDADLARILTAATGGDPETPAEQGAADGKSLQDGQLSPEESKRLEENTTLTPAQQDALIRGELVLPASQMDYLNRLARSLDGKSTPEIKELMDKLGANGGRLQDALQLVGNEHVRAAGVDASLKPGDAGYVPGRGSFEALPDGLRRDLTKFPLDFVKTRVGAGVYPQARQELRDLAFIIDKGNPALQQGSAMDAHMLKQAELMLDNSKVPADALPMVKGQVDPILEAMLSAAGRDQIAVHDALAGSDGHTTNEEFISNLMTHQWADDGAAAGGLLNGTAPVAVPTDLTDPTQLAQATRAGQTMHAVDLWAGAHASDLLNIADNIADTDGQSLGQVNPELTRALASANIPYLDDMLGNPLDNTRGFDPLDSLTNPEMPNTRDLFAVIDSDHEAASTLNSQAYLNGLQYQGGFEQSIIDGGPVDVADIQSAGTLRGVIDTAANIADNDATAYGNLQDVRAYESRGEWLDVAKTLGGEIPGVKDLLDGVGKMPGDPLHQIFVGDTPTPDPTKHTGFTSSEALQYSVAQELLNNNVGSSAAFEQWNLIDSQTGKLVPLTDDRMDDFRNAFPDYFNGVNPSVKQGIEDFEDGYRDAFPKPPGHTGG